MLTGLRKSNILNLRWSQLDLLKGVVSISGSEMKNGNDHVVRLSDVALKITAAQLVKHATHVFTYKGRKANEINTIARRNTLTRRVSNITVSMTTGTHRHQPSFRMVRPCRMAGNGA
ncbi:tyrosine-type recombinase/integrase [Oxalobacter paraformigenes]|uniref:tyrosine-type recombinase/integrase n=1 Tax=Oxalobacter paraformigenes TaxID=556268 RepID=UPI000684C5A1